MVLRLLSKEIFDSARFILKVRIAPDWVDKLRARRLSKEEGGLFSLCKGTGQLSWVCLRLDLAHKLFKALDLPLEFAACFTVRLLAFFLITL